MSNTNNNLEAPVETVYGFEARGQQLMDATFGDINSKINSIQKDLGRYSEQPKEALDLAVAEMTHQEQSELKILTEFVGPTLEQYKKTLESFGIPPEAVLVGDPNFRVYGPDRDFASVAVSADLVKDTAHLTLHSHLGKNEVGRHITVWCLPPFDEHNRKDSGYVLNFEETDIVDHKGESHKYTWLRVSKNGFSTSEQTVLANIAEGDRRQVHERNLPESLTDEDKQAIISGKQIDIEATVAETIRGAKEGKTKPTLIFEQTP